jgi:hypothetical protein
MSAKLSDRFEFERVLWRQNLTRVAGVDEVRYGPVVAGAAISFCRHQRRRLVPLEPRPPAAPRKTFAVKFNPS